MKRKKTRQNQIPDAFGSVVKAVEEVCSEFESKEVFHQLDSKRWIRNIKVALDEQINQIAFVLDVESSILAVYVIFSIPDSRKKMLEFLTAISRANFGRLNGCFEIDFDTGETRFRNSLNLRDNKANTREIAQLLSEALLMIRTYAPAFQRIIESDADPLETIDKIEN